MKARTLVSLTLTLTAIAGCSNFGAALGGFVDGYCAQPAADRQINRAVINQQLAPNSIVITCARDADNHDQAN